MFNKYGRAIFKKKNVVEDGDVKHYVLNGTDLGLTKAELRLLKRVYVIRACWTVLVLSCHFCHIGDFGILFCRFHGNGLLKIMVKDDRGCRPECNWVIKQEKG